MKKQFIKDKTKMVGLIGAPFTLVPEYPNRLVPEIYLNQYIQFSKICLFMHLF